MALIKCSECGKEFSDKASSCIHCGAPVEKIEQKDNSSKKGNGKVINAELDIKMINKNNFIPSILFALIVGVPLTCAMIPTIIDNIKFHQPSGLGWLIVVFVGLVVFPIAFAFYNVHFLKKQELTINEDKIIGKIKPSSFSSLSTIDLPLKQISSVKVIDKFLFKPTKLFVCTSSGEYKISYIKNYDEIRETISERIS